jgi:DMSO/TMAO reductase YedYZ heme-binding membrane subunit
MHLKDLTANIRFYVLLFSISLAAVVYLYFRLTIPEGGLQIVKLTQTYALIAVTFLYFTLLASPATRFFTFLPYRGKYLKARRALGVSAFLFALLHAYFAFFGELGGFAGLQFLSGKYLIAITLSTISLIILALMASTASEAMVEKLTYPKWKMLHRFVYAVAIFTIIHALMLGSHFVSFAGWIPQVFFVALVFLGILESIRLDNYLTTKYPALPKFGVAVTLFLIAAVLLAFFLISPGQGNLSLGIHSQHIQQARQAQQTTTTTKIPGLDGDRTKRYSVQFLYPDFISPGVETKVGFRVIDASNGSEVKLFKPIYEKLMHLIVVDSELNYFNHIHPEQTEEGFRLPLTFPKSGQYRLYVDFQPLGGIEQQFAFTLNVGGSEVALSEAVPDNNFTKIFGQYEVTLDFPKPLMAQSMSLGEQRLSFTFKDASTKQAITTLKPYLASFGHLVMINKDTYDYLHVHPTNLVAPKPDENGGPRIEFMPLGLYGSIKPGVYRVFGQFNPNGELMVVDYTVRVE